MKKNLFTKALFAMGAVALMASCAKSTDLFDQDAIDAQKKADAQAEVEQLKLTYAENFVKKYGAVDPNQSWDLTTGAKLGTITRDGSDIDNSAQGVTTINASLVAGLDFTLYNNTPYGEYRWGKFVPYNSKSLYYGIKEVLPDGKTHSGEKVVLAAPTCDFYIYPVTVQGAWLHSLKVKIGDQDPIELYHKTWTDYDQPYFNGLKVGNSTIVMKGIHIQAPIGTPIDVYVDQVQEAQTKNGRVTYVNKPSMGTFNGKAIYVTPKAGTTITPGFQMKPNAVIKYIGIEDNGGESTDNDYNDVTLVVVGNPDIPVDIPVKTEIVEVPTNTSKRYMIEDLGTADDFDFNDIVVDVYQTSVKKWKKTTAGDIVISNEYLGEEVGDQEAIIRAMGGTLDFTITIGNTSWTKSTGAPFDPSLTAFNTATMYNTQKGYIYDKVLAKFTVTGWKPGDNNISVEVVKDVDTSVDNDHIVWEIPFPKTGDIPMIVAVDATEAWNWMNERVGVPAWWIKEDSTEQSEDYHVEGEDLPTTEE